MKITRPLFLKVAGMGMLTGIRSLHGPAMAVPALMSRGGRGRFSSFRRARSRRLEWILGSLAVAESIGDKLPFIPDRIAKAPLIGRLLFGGLTGVLTYRALGKKDGAGMAWSAALGGAGAVAGAFAAYFIRRQAGRMGKTADLVCGLGEDVLVNRVGKKLLA